MRRESFQTSLQMRFEVLRVMSMKVAVFWNIAVCSLVDID
jgi:hypothetical protein